MSDTISHIRSILDNYDSTQKAEDKLQAIASAIQQVASKPTNDKRDSDEVAVLKLEINNLKGKLGDYQAKMNKSHSELVEKLNSTQRQLRGKTLVEGHMKNAIEEAHSELSRIQETLKCRDDNLKEKTEYIEILEKRIDRNKSSYEKIIDDLKKTVVQQNDTIQSLEESMMSVVNNRNMEIEKFKKEKFDASMRIQEFMEQVADLKKQLDARSDYADMEKKLHEAEICIEGKNDENSEALEHIKTLNKSMQVLKNENAELVRRINQTRNELKVTRIRYEKLEKAFAESIPKIMRNDSDKPDGI